MCKFTNRYLHIEHLEYVQNSVANKSRRAQSTPTRLTHIFRWLNLRAILSLKKFRHFSVICHQSALQPYFFFFSQFELSDKGSENQTWIIVYSCMLFLTWVLWETWLRQSSNECFIAECLFLHPIFGFPGFENVCYFYLRLNSRG